MRQTLFLVALAAVIAMGAVGTASAQSPGEDSVIGTLAVSEQECIDFGGGFIQCLLPNRYVFDAHSGAAGQNPTGTVDFVIGERLGLSIDPGSVSCLAVSGHRASIGVDFRGFNLADPHSAVIFVEDRGGEAQDSIAVQDLPPGVSAPSTCPGSPPPGVNFQPTYPVNFLDWHVTVTDATARPTTKAQCKNDGWESYGLFKNQGDCVSYVATRGGNPPVRGRLGSAQ